MRCRVCSFLRFVDYLLELFRQRWCFCFWFYFCLAFFCFHGITFCTWVLEVSIFCDILRLDVVIVLFPLLSFDTRGSESIKRTLSGQSACSIPSTNQFYIQRLCMYILFILYCQTGRKSLKIQRGNWNP